MDWRFVSFVLEEGLPGLIGLMATLPVFLFAAAPDRKLRAMSASLADLGTFIAACLLAGVPAMESSRMARAFPLVGAAAVLALLAPAFLALRYRWLGALHLVTVAASAYLWFVATLAVSKRNRR